MNITLNFHITHIILNMKKKCHEEIEFLIIHCNLYLNINISSTHAIRKLSNIVIRQKKRKNILLYFGIDKTY